MIEFVEVMRSFGIDPPDTINKDGRLHRFGKNKNGWYIVYSEISGSFGWWPTGLSENWFSNREFTEEQKAEYKEKMLKQRELREKEDRENKKACRKKARFIWEKSETASCHSYLSKKQVKPNGIKINNNSLVIPVRDSSGELHGLQFIRKDGSKKFLSGTAKRGCYFSIGQIDNVIYVCEGFATAASVHESSGHAVASAFDSGNLVHVAVSLRRKFPEIKIVICADNDGAGIKGAESAARACKGTIVMPDIDGFDFNDLYNLHGSERVRETIESEICRG